MSSKRKRGIQASKTKLAAALAKSDILPKKQTAIANAIADREGLDSAPRDLVNKVFLEFYVDPQTIERVAAVLNVDAKDLYKDPSEMKAKETDVSHQKTPQSKNNHRARTILWSGLLVILLSVVMIVLPRETSFLEAKCEGLSNAITSTSPNKLGVVIGRFSNDPDNEVQILLADAFASDSKFSNQIEVFTSCNNLKISQFPSYFSGMLSLRNIAQKDMKAVDAHIFIWGERSQNNVNIRYTSLRDNSQEATIVTGEKSIKTDETSFSLPYRLTEGRQVQAEVKELAFDFMVAQSEKRIQSLTKLRSQFERLEGWLRSAVISDRNLLKTISPTDNPYLYVLTGNQLCYRYRLLADHEYSKTVFQEAEEVCKKVISNITSQEFVTARAVVQNNLGTVLIRKHLFASDVKSQIEILKGAVQTFLQAEQVLSKDETSLNYSSLNSNLSIAYVRLGALSQGDVSVKYLLEAKRRANLSLDNTDKQTRPRDYAIIQQNLCLIGNTLAERTKKVKYVNEAILNCSSAIQFLSKRTDPQVWGTAQNNLAISYAQLADLSHDAGALQNALSEFTKAQTVFTRESFLANWAEVETNKGLLYCQLAVLSKDKTYLDESKKHANAALEVFVEKNITRYANFVSSLIDKAQICAGQDIQDCKCAP